MANVADTFAFALRQHQAGDLATAERLYRDILQADGNHADALHLLGLIAHQTGHHDQAITLIRQALALRPWAAVFYLNLGAAYQALGQNDAAVTAYLEVLRYEPHSADAHINLGNVLCVMGRFEEALAYCRFAIELRPNSPQAHANLGNVFLGQKEYDEAIVCFDTALQIDPHNAKAHNSRGIAMVRLDRLEEAQRGFQTALKCEPHFADAHNNLGSVLHLQRDLHGALRGFTEALRLNPNMADAHVNRAVVWLLLGDLERGFPEYEWRWVRYAQAKRDFPQPRWDGSPLSGRTILLYGEQGLGDTLQFVRYAPLVKERGGTVVLECQSPLGHVLKSALGVDLLLTRGSALPAFDVHAPLLDLPSIFRTNLANIPAKIPYLDADPRLVEHWRRELSALGGFKIGISWQGDPINPSPQRTIPIAAFAKIAEIEGVRLISLQKGPGEEQIRSATPQFPVVDFGHRLDKASGPFMDTAAIMKSLDLLICSDTAPPHLAGAMGLPVWVALPLVVDWRWLLHREDTPWYPSMRLFRQTKAGCWDDVFDRMANEVKTLVEARAGISTSR